MIPIGTGLSFLLVLRSHCVSWNLQEVTKWPSRLVLGRLRIMMSLSSLFTMSAGFQVWLAYHTVASPTEFIYICQPETTCLQKTKNG